MDSNLNGDGVAGSQWWTTGANHDSLDPADAPQQEEDSYYDQLSSHTDDIDYYSLLALPRDPPPTDAQIRAAYRTLTLSFHPDKQPPHLRETATKQFDRIRTAYETLVDPKKRVVYDMLGEEGVKAEWRARGAMGMGGEAEKLEVGVKAMDQKQFRSWFLGVMKKRERKLLDDMVGSKGSIQLNIDARSMFYRKFDGSSGLRVPTLKATSYTVGYNFKTPFSPSRWIRLSTREDEKEEDEDEEDKKYEKIPDASEEETELEIHAGIGGKLQHFKQVVEFENPDTGKEETQEILLPLVLISQNLTLGATVRHAISPDANGGAARNALKAGFGGSIIEVGGSILPSPTVHTTITKAVPLVKGTRPLQVSLQTSFSDSPWKFPPTFVASATRQFGVRKIAFCNWGSGQLFWPELVKTIFSPVVSLGPLEDTTLIHSGQPSKFEIGLVALPLRRPAHSGRRAEDQEEDLGDEDMDPLEHVAIGNSQESWSCQIHTSPAALQLSVNYARNLFTSKPEEPIWSEWNQEGYHPHSPSCDPRPVRLEIVTTIGVDLSLGWMVSGTRRFGDFTRMGLGIGVEGHKGLVFSLSWNRLGQSIKLPIVVCPLEFVSENLSTLAVVVPWATYSAVEFCVLRPRERRRRRQEIARQRKRLRKLVGKRKADSAQAISLMREQVKRKQAREGSRDGLVILLAEYGVPPSPRKKGDKDTESSGEMIDVTIPMAALVDQGQLVISHKVIKSQILGFYDPAPLRPKVLRIRYLFSGQEHFVEVDDSEALMCPMKSHLER
ncbi:hypothetical protein AJ80_06723 [Polytolypa hystricis UAMH7299]|uniref:J domain-containing protein n=1 Tax=Polytolypa hystricis (strain UAMH7299) TaxID=1447883 RepID=A0A2B7XT94_POLH7|nr:hypothetical protein AJ80_06723 [Polytolypa hystricis UAMH7299]